MLGRRTWLAALLIAVALVLQVAVVTRLPLPGGVVPDLVLLVVASLALVTGPMRGAVTGFVAGLVTDVVPPAYHTIGRYALVYCLVGYVAGLASDEAEDSAFLPFLTVALGAVGGTALYVGVGAVLDDPRVTWQTASGALPLSALYDVILSPFVLYAIARLAKRVEPEPAGHKAWRPHGHYPRP